MLPTMGVAADRPSLLTVAKAYLKKKYDKPGNVYLGIISRLDAPVTGVVVMARTSKAAARLSEQFRTRTVEKVYWAIVAGSMSPAQGTCVDWLRKDERHRRVFVVSAGTSGAQQARLSYKTLRQLPQGRLLEIQLETGRKHQIRVQLAEQGCPILGDRKYGSHKLFPAGIGLHSRSIQFEHPVLKQPICLTAPLPQSWQGFVAE